MGRMRVTDARRPTKAYVVGYVVGVHMEAVVYANNADEAVDLVEAEDCAESTGRTYRVTRPKARRAPEDDR